MKNTLKKMKKNYFMAFTLLCAMSMLSSCGVFSACRANYAVSLSSTERTNEADTQESKIVVVNDKGLGDRYVDDIIDIDWTVVGSNLFFDLTNKTSKTIRINWDNISYIDINGKSGRIMHEGVKYIDRNNSQPETIVPKGSTLSDVLTPTENVFYSSIKNDWVSETLIPSYFKTPKERNLVAPIYVGKKMSVYMPIIVEGGQMEYLFEFIVDGVLSK